MERYRAAVTVLASPPALEETDRSVNQGLMGAGVAVAAWASGTVIAKAIDMGGMAIGVYRFALFSIILIAWIRVRGVQFNLEVMRKSAVGGLALGLDIALFFSAVKLTNVVNATLIGSLQPIFVGIVAAKFFGEKIHRRDVLWSGVALAGVVLVVMASNGTPQWSLAGDLLAVGAMLTWGMYFIASKQSKTVLTSGQFTAGTSVWTVLVNIPLAVAFGQDLGWPTATSWKLLFLMILVSGLVGHSLMNWSLVRIPLWIGSVMTLLIPVAASAIAWVFLDEPLSVAQAAPMALVLGALAMVIRNQSNRQVTKRAIAANR